MKNPTLILTMGVLAALVLFIAGCDTTSPSAHEDELVVESYLVAGESLPPVWLSRSLDIDATWTSVGTAVQDAQVQIELLTEEGGVEETFIYRRTIEAPGMFVTDVDHTVLPERRYRLRAQAAGLQPITSETTVPEAFYLLEVSHEVIEYQDPEQFSYLVTRSQFEDRQSIFVFTIANDNPVPENLVPVYRDLIFDREELESGEPLTFDPEDQLALARFTSPPINEGNYDVLPDGILRVRLPWFAVAFYGPTQITMSILDDNLYDFQRYQQVQQGGGLLSPGEIPNVLDPVVGGAGIFGSMAQVSSVVTVVPATD